MSLAHLTHVPFRLPDLPQPPERTTLIEIPGHGMASFEEIAYLKRLQAAGVTELTPEMKHDLAQLGLSTRAGIQIEEHPHGHRFSEEGSSRGRLVMTIAKWGGISFLGLTILLALVYLVFGRSPDGASDSGEPGADVLVTQPSDAPDEAVADGEEITDPRDDTATSSRDGTYTFGPLFDLDGIGAHLDGGTLVISTGADGVERFEGTVTYGDSLFRSSETEWADCVYTATVSFAGEIDPAYPLAVGMASEFTDASHEGPDCLFSPPDAPDITFERGEEDLEELRAGFLDGTSSYLFLRTDVDPLVVDFPQASSELTLAN